MNTILHPIADATSGAEFEALARECRVLAAHLASFSRGSYAARAAAPASDDGRAMAGQLRRYLSARRLRDTLFPHDLFADPAWDILLDLFASELEGKHVSVSSACIASGVPSPTALRWLHRLEELGLIKREPDGADDRRAALTLTSAGREPLARWLEDAPWQHTMNGDR